MCNSVYQINNDINKSIEFKGLKAQHIWYVADELVLLLIVFADMTICEVNVFICLSVADLSGIA
ncbi:MAG: DUF4133 domain-containing protein [Ginsengibacter sp.]